MSTSILRFGNDTMEIFYVNLSRKCIIDDKEVILLRLDAAFLT